MLGSVIICKVFLSWVFVRVVEHNVYDRYMFG